MANTTTKSALIVVDMQEDFCKPRGSLGIEGAAELAPIINGLLDRPGFALRIATKDFHPQNHVSFASQHKDATAMVSKYEMTNPENNDEKLSITLWPDHCIQGSWGCDIIPTINQDKFAHVIHKGWDRRLESFSGFGPPFRIPAVAMTQLNEVLKGQGITHLFVVGVGFDGCVKSTAIDAVEYGYRTYVVQEGVNAAFRSQETRTTTLNQLRASGVDIISVHSKEMDMVQAN